MMAHDDNRRVTVNTRSPIDRGTHGMEYSTINARNTVFVRLAHINQHKWFVALAHRRHFCDSELTIQWMRAHVVNP